MHKLRAAWRCLHGRCVVHPRQWANRFAGQGGSAETLFDSVRKKLFALPDDTIVYPGHDYHGRVSSTIGEEKQFNERLNLSVNKGTFIEMMNRRNTPRPAKMDIAVPANMSAGRMVGP